MTSPVMLRKVGAIVDSFVDSFAVAGAGDGTGRRGEGRDRMAGGEGLLGDQPADALRGAEDDDLSGGDVHGRLR
ncbi:MAG: hypothetical protein JWM57_3080 [Phycisphaerales bacterium]|nr:hypothetical protein [Phycisphaerales bacterium]